MPDVLLSFVGTLLALGVSKTAERYVVRKLEAGDLARDALVDILSAMTSVESALPSLMRDPLPRSAGDLPLTYSGWDISLPAFSQEKLLSLFDEEEIHGLVILYFDRAHHFQLRAKQHADAFYWLLDHPGITSWDDPQAAERLGVLKATRASLLEYARDMLRFGYRFAERLLRHATGFNVMRWNRPPIETFLRKHFKFDQAGIQLRRAYYSLYQVPGPFDSSVDHLLVIWEDDIAAGTAHLGGTLAVETEVPGSSALQTWRLPAIEAVAIPRPHLATMVSGRVGWPGTTIELRHPKLMPLPTTYGAGWPAYRLALNPEDVAAAKRQLRSCSLPSC